MTPFIFHLRHCGSNSAAKFSTQFNLSYSTSLSQLFSQRPTCAAAVNESDDKSENSEFHGARRTKTKKARNMARLVNSETWSSRLETSLSSIPSISQSTILQTLRLIKNPSKALRFFNWLQDSGFVLTHNSYFIMLEILGRARNLNAARNFLLSIPKKSKNAVPLTDKFFNSLIRSYGSAGLLQEPLKVFQSMKSMGISPSTLTFNTLFLIFLKRGRLGTVFDLYKEMLSTFGAKPDIYTFNILIKGFCVNSRIDDAFKIFDDIEKFQCKPDLITYNTIIDGLCRAGKVDAAQNVVNCMHKKGEDLSPNVVSYTSLIRGYFGKRELKDAMDVFRNMVESGIKPNEITYNTIIQGLCVSQSLKGMKEILSELPEGDHGGFVPDTCSFNTVMNARCKEGNVDEAVKIFEKMAELNVKRDSTTYSVLIRALCQEGKFHEAERLLDELFDKKILLEADGCVPLAAAYNPIFHHLCANGKTMKAEGVFRQLMKRGIQDPPAYETLILGHSKEGTSESGHKLLVLMLRRDFVPRMETYENLINDLLCKGKANLAYDTLERMLRSSHLPRASMFQRVLGELVNQSSALESASLIAIMLEKEIRLNINLSTDTIKLMFEKGLRSKAFLLIQNLYKYGYIVKIEELIASLCQDRKFLDANELLLFSLKNELSVDIAISSTVITNLCKQQKLSVAFHLYHELLEKGLQLPSSCLQGLRIALETEGKSREAEFIAKRVLN